MLVGGGGKAVELFSIYIYYSVRGRRVEVSTPGFFVLGSVEGCCACVTACQK